MVTFDPALPDSANVGDSGHVTDHNAIVAALTALNDGKPDTSVTDALAARLDALEGTPALIPYGSAVSFDALANMQVGGPASGTDNVWISLRFKAEQSSTLESVRMVWADETYEGYGGGTGGTYTVSIKADSGGFPTGADLAAETGLEYTTDFPLTTFSSPYTVTEGTLYHVCVTNTDATPITNYSSIDTMWVNPDTIGSLTPRQPKWADADFAVCRKLGTAGSWAEQPDFTPIVDITYGNGQHQGNGYMQVIGYSTPETISGDDMVRERFTVSGGSRVVTGAAVRVAKTSGTGALTVRLEESNGTLIDSFTIPAASIPTLTPPAVPAGIYVEGEFTAPRTLTNGATYSLRLSCAADTSFWVRIAGDGTDYGFNAATCFGDGYVQISDDAGSTWELTASDVFGDLQFYFV